MANFISLNFHALDVAKLIIKKYNDNNVYISNLILQKLLFFVQRNALQNKRTRLFEEDFEAWKFGPVVPEVYYNYCHYGSYPLELKVEDSLKTDSTIQTLIDSEFQRCRSKSPFELVQETHQPGSAWSVIVQNGLGLREVIPVSLIFEKG